MRTDNFDSLKILSLRSLINSVLHRVNKQNKELSQKLQSPHSMLYRRNPLSIRKSIGRDLQFHSEDKIRHGKKRFWTEGAEKNIGYLTSEQIEEKRNRSKKTLQPSHLHLNSRKNQSLRSQLKCIDSQRQKAIKADQSSLFSDLQKGNRIRSELNEYPQLPGCSLRKHYERTSQNIQCEGGYQNPQQSPKNSYNQQFDQGVRRGTIETKDPSAKKFPPCRENELVAKSSHLRESRVQKQTADEATDMTPLGLSSELQYHRKSRQRLDSGNVSLKLPQLSHNSGFKKSLGHLGKLRFSQNQSSKAPPAEDSPECPAYRRDEQPRRLKTLGIDLDIDLSFDAVPAKYGDFYFKPALAGAQTTKERRRKSKVSSEFSPTFCNSINYPLPYYRNVYEGAD